MSLDAKPDGDEAHMGRVLAGALAEAFNFTSPPAQPQTTTSYFPLEGAQSRVALLRSPGAPA